MFDWRHLRHTMGHRALTRRGFLCGAIALGLLAAPSEGWSGGKRTIGVPPGERGVRGGVVTTSEPIAAEIGAKILRRGGNAIDAAVAVQGALAVIEPQSSGIGGGGFMMIHLAKKKKTFVLDSRERAPAAASPDMFLTASDPSSAFSFGIRSTSGIGVGVPGTVLGLSEALDRWGTISLKKALAPAIELAETGFPVSSRFVTSAGSSRLDNEPGNPAYDLARSIYRPGGAVPKEGDILKIPALAKTLRMIAEDGPSAFYKGPIAEAIVATQRNARTQADPADQAKLVGRMTLEDLANYETAVRRPVTGKYRGFKIVSMPPPSSGGLTLIHMLNLLERFPIGDESKGFGFGQTRTLNVMLEAMRLAFADRAVWMGDDDFVEVPSRGLLSQDYSDLRSALIDPDSRRSGVVADDPRPFDTAGYKKGDTQLAAGIPNDDEGRNTTHFTVIDRYGNIVTYTSTIESAWGTGLVVPGFGFLLNNELTDFNARPASNADAANFNPGANDAAPNKRPRSSMAPTMVFKGKRPLAAYGSPGGSSIINTVLNITLNLIDHDQNIDKAIANPRVTASSPTGTAFLEEGFDPDVVRDLQDLGHDTAVGSFVQGSVQAVIVGRNKRQFGSADARRIGGEVAVKRKEIRRKGDDDDDDGGGRRGNDDDDDDGGRRGADDDDD